MATLVVALQPCKVTAHAFLSIAMIVFLSTLSSVRVFAQGTLVPGGVTAGVLGPYVEVRVIQNPNNGDYTGFVFQPVDSTTFVFAPALDEGVRTFLVSLNSPISESAILSGSYPELLSLNSYTFANNSTFYLGFYTGPSFPQNGVYADPLFGWGRFWNNNGTIQLLGGELAYQSGGILAGTQTLLPVPEPSVVALGVLGAAGIGYGRWRKREKKAAPHHTGRRALA